MRHQIGPEMFFNDWNGELSVGANVSKITGRQAETLAEHLETYAAETMKRALQKGTQNWARGKLASKQDREAEP